MTHKLSLLIVVFLVISPVSAQTTTPIPYTISDPVPYNINDSAQTITLYLPDIASRKSLTLFMPYGEYFPDLVQYFAERGYGVLSIGLRENGDFLMQMQDVFCALAWAHNDASTYGFAPAQIVPVGGSMHGGLVSLLAMIDDPAPYLEGCSYSLPETGRVHGVVAFSGVFDYSQEADFFAGFIDNVSDSYMGGTREEIPERWAEASAMTWIDGDEPPFLLLHGTSDTNVNIHQSELFAVALAEAGVDVEFIAIPRATHRSLITSPEAFAAMEMFLESDEKF